MTKNNTSLPPPPSYLISSNNDENKLNDEMKNIKLKEVNDYYYYNQASLDSNISNAFKHAMNGQGDYSFVRVFFGRGEKNQNSLF
jgi:hypothetical protein